MGNVTLLAKAKIAGKISQLKSVKIPKETLQEYQKHSLNQIYQKKILNKKLERIQDKLLEKENYSVKLSQDYEHAIE